MSKNVLMIAIAALMISVPAMADSGSMIINNVTGQVTTDVWNGVHSNHYLDVIGNGMNGQYNWSTDVHSTRGTALVGGVSLTSTGDASAYFSNWVDFSATTGAAKEGLQKTVIYGNGISLTQNAGRHQGYAMTETINLSVAGPDAGGNYMIDNSTVLTDPAGLTAYHDIYVTGTSGSASIVNDGWTHAAVRAQGITFDSDGGSWGPTGQPVVNATGTGTFQEQVYGSTFAMFGVGAVGGGITPVITMPAGGTITIGGPFTSGLSAQGMAMRANNGGI